MSCWRSTLSSLLPPVSLDIDVVKILPLSFRQHFCCYDMLWADPDPFFSGECLWRVYRLSTSEPGKHVQFLHDFLFTFFMFKASFLFFFFSTPAKSPTNIESVQFEERKNKKEHFKTFLDLQIQTQLNCLASKILAQVSGSCHYCFSITWRNLHLLFFGKKIFEHVGNGYQNQNVSLGCQRCIWGKRGEQRVERQPSREQLAAMTGRHPSGLDGRRQVLPERERSSCTDKHTFANIAPIFNPSLLVKYDSRLFFVSWRPCL